VSVVSEDFTCRWLEGQIIEVRANRPGLTRIYWSSSPDGFTDDNELEAFEGETVFANPLGQRRCFLHLVGSRRYTVATPRVLIPDGRCNLRDLGGYNTRDDRFFVRQGIVYRSGVIRAHNAALSRAAREIKPALVADFRFSKEIDMEGKSAPIDGALYQRFCPTDEVSIPGFVTSYDDFITQTVDDLYKLRKSLIESYTTMPFANGAFGDFLRAVLTAKGPVIFHCSAGKDRTGIASALLLLALDISDEAIIEDYLLTAKARSVQLDERIADYAQRADGGEDYREALHEYLAPTEEGIRAMMEVVRSHHGSIEAYFEQELGLTTNNLRQLREKLLVPHNIEYEV